ncbi:hypothetical protein ACE2AJ_03195 [Aquihabitans daechungensis]|uniref:hypothetical protein n=1 Tax=Aquihabitans daechungensis TaxID=1052257 RepID=UPI003BA148B5
MRRDWKQKAALQRVFSRLPGGHRLNYAFQRHLTHGLPVDDPALDAQLELARHHVEQFCARGACPLEDASFFEFGAGWDFAMPLSLHALGVRHQLVVDLRRLGRLDLARDIDDRVSARARPRPSPPPPQTSGRSWRIGASTTAPRPMPGRRACRTAPSTASPPPTRSSTSRPPTSPPSTGSCAASSLPTA